MAEQSINAPETQETPKEQARKKLDGSEEQSLLTSLIRKAIAEKIDAPENEGGGTRFYDEAMKHDSARKTVLPILQAYKTSEERYTELDSKRIDTLTEEEIRGYVVRAAADIESDRQALISVLKNDYQTVPTDDQITRLRAATKNLSRTELAERLRRPDVRNQFVQKTLGADSGLILPEIDDVLEGFGIAENLKKVTKQQKAILKSLIADVNHHASNEDIQAILPLFRTRNQRIALLRRYMPTVRLGDLHRLGIINGQERKKLAGDFLAGNETLRAHIPDVDTFLRYRKADDISISTELLSNEQITKLFETSGFSSLADEINLAKKTIREGQSQAFEDLKDSYEWVTTTDLDEIDEKKKSLYVAQKFNKTKKDYSPAEWSNLFEVVDPAPTTAELEKLEADCGSIDFKKKLVDRLKAEEAFASIANRDKLQVGSVIVGNVTETTGETTTLYLRIDKLDGGAVHPEVQITNLTNPEGGILKEDADRGIKGTTETIHYDDLVAVLKGFKEGSRVLSPEELAGEIRDQKIAETVPQDQINSIKELEDKINAIDPAGRSCPLAVGLSFQMNANAEIKDRYVVGTIGRIDPVTRNIWLSNGAETE